MKAIKLFNKNFFPYSETENAGYVPALIHYGDQARLAPGYRDSHRVMIDDTKFAEILSQRIGHLLPETFESHKRLQINERLRFLR